MIQRPKTGPRHHENRGVQGFDQVDDVAPRVEGDEEPARAFDDSGRAPKERASARTRANDGDSLRRAAATPGARGARYRYGHTEARGSWHWVAAFKASASAGRRLSMQPLS